MKEATETGMNRTGAAMHPQMIKEMEKGSQEHGHAPGDEHAMDEMRSEYVKRGATIGSVPMPASAKGAAKTGVAVIKGEKPSIFMDKLGERLAFERSGTRLYEALLAKFDIEGGWSGGPTREQLEHFHDAELAHFQMLKDTIESMGADPTAITPSADVAGINSEGLLKTITDPRIPLAQSLDALLAAELVDNDAWGMLHKLSQSLGYDDMAKKFQQAKKEEDEHLQHVRQWLTSHVERGAKGKQS